jgi:cytochrome P450
MELLKDLNDNIENNLEKLIHSNKGTYAEYCFNEALRFDPPAKVSTEKEFFEDTVIGGVTIKAN